ncbi:MAG: hypothetical protein ACP5NC_07430 [Nitrososphaeria archaeon]
MPSMLPSFSTEAGSSDSISLLSTMIMYTLENFRSASLTDNLSVKPDDLMRLNIE